MKRLIKKSIHDIKNRDDAFLYIDGNILIGVNHPNLIKEYLSDDKNIDDDYAMQFSEFERNNNVSIDDISLAFGHIIYDEVDNETDEEYDMAIYLETNNIINTTIDEVITAIKNKFGDIPIFDDSSYNSFGNSSDKYKRLASKINKIAQYLHCHDCGWDNNDFLLEDDGSKTGWAENMQDRKFKRLYKEQIYHSLKEFQDKNLDKKCPKCGSNDLDID